jgi:hypothetical protein
LTDLGYKVHSPAELFGSRDDAEGTEDEVWLPIVGKRGWLIIATDLKIFERREEYEAYLRARVAVFLLPGQSLTVERVALVERNVAAMCSEASQRRAGVWRLTHSGIEVYHPPAAKPRARRTGSRKQKNG